MRQNERLNEHITWSEVQHIMNKPLITLLALTAIFALRLPPLPADVRVSLAEVDGGD